MTASAETLAALSAIVGPAHLVTAVGELERYERDWRGRYRGATGWCVSTHLKDGSWRHVFHLLKS